MPFRFNVRRSLGLPIGGGGGAILKPQDVFAILAQPANAMQAAIDALPFAPDLLIDKDRGVVGSWSWRNRLIGFGQTLASDTTGAEAAFAGYSGTSPRVVYAFKRSAKFLDIISRTGDGASNRQVPHALGAVPGMGIVKGRSNSFNWLATHRSLSNPFSDYLTLNTTNAVAPGDASLFVGASSTSITLGNSVVCNASGQTYLDHLFAHDPSADGIVQCGSSTSDSGGTFTIPHGWAGGAQWLIYKCSSTTGNWVILDTARTPGFSGSDAFLRANTSDAEVSSDIVSQSTGALSVSAAVASAQFVWAIIRAPY